MSNINLVSSEAAIIGTTSDFAGLQHIMRERKDYLGISNNCLDELAGLSDGYSNKLMARPPAKNLGTLTFDLLLQALGLKLIVVEDVETMRRYAGQLVKRQEKQVRTPNLLADPVEAWKKKFAQRGSRAALKVVTPEMRRANGRKGGRARMHSTTPEQRSRWSRKGINKRWRDYRAAQKKKKERIQNGQS